ncbi:MAG TPA: M23 family metallopeptidase [Herpetosiphonaceae bacterium]
MLRRASGFARLPASRRLPRSRLLVLLVALLSGLALAPAVTSAALSPDRQQLSDPVLGLTLSYPASWSVVHDPYLFPTYGFILRSAPADAANGHGRSPVARVAMHEQTMPDQLDAVVQAKQAEYPDVPMQRWTVPLGAGLTGVALGPVPGGQVSINVYVAANGRVYQINYYGEKLDAQAHALLASLRFSRPTRSVASLNLADASSDEALYGGPRPAQPEADPKREAAAAAEGDPWITEGEYQLSNGCWAQPTTFFIQTTHSWDANSHENPGWSKMGTPNFWGDNTHGNWGLGKCTHDYYTNDYYAIDYYLNRGDRLYNPFKEGYVTYAGWDPDNWWNYGRMVVIKTPSGKFWSLSAHMSAINVSKGQYVTDATLIGWAGSSGYADPYPHVHQVFYRYAQTSAGRPYGGQGVKQTALTYLGNGGGVYTNFFQGKWTSW